MPLTSSILRRIADFDADKVKFRGDAKAVTALASQTTNLDFKVIEERLFTGLQILANAISGDYCALSVVDVDNILGYGAGTVLDTFVTKWYLDSTADNQGIFTVGYPAFILAGLYIRVSYTNVGIVGVSLRVNYFLHKPIV